MGRQQPNGSDRRKLSSLLPYYLFLRPLQVVARSMPPRQAALLGTAVGELIYRGVPRYRRVALRNLSAAFGWDAVQTETVARLAFRNIGKTLVEFFQMPGWSEAEVRRRCQLDGLEHVKPALDQGRGVLVITAHYGNWELFAARVVAEGIPLSVVAREADDAATNTLTHSIRAACGYQVIPRRSAPRGVMEALRRNGVVALLMDQNTVKGGEFVPFFGRLAATVTGPAVFALRTGAAIIPAFAIRQRDDGHIGQILPPVTPVQTGDRDRDVWQLTSQLTSIIEAQIRADPTQWFWIHDRWRHRPPLERAMERSDAGGEECGVNSEHDVSTHPAT